MAGKVSIGSAWSEAIAFITREARLLAPVVLGLILLPAVVTSMVQPQVAPGETPEPGSWMLIAFVMLMVMLLGQLAIVVLVDGWRGSVGEAIGRAARRLPTLLLAGLLVFVPLIILASVALAIAGVASGSTGQITPKSLSGPGLLVLLLLVVGLLFITVRLLTLIALVARGQDGPLASLKSAFRMTRGQFWRLLGFLLLSMIVFLVVLAAAGAVFGSVIALALGPPEPWTVSLLLVALVGALVQTAFVTIYTAMLARITAQLADRPVEPSAG